MNFTFITIHDLSAEAIILYASDSLIDVLGFIPDEVIGKAAWEFFLPTHQDAAKILHKRSAIADKASVLVYCDILNSANRPIRCECVFSVAYNVIVACTSVYRRTTRAIQRRNHAPIIRRRFSSSINDPRYHMLSHLSSRFQATPKDEHEVRAALFLNRFTQSLTVMYATSAIMDIIGISSDDLKGRSFYDCIRPENLTDATRAIDSAKTNDSIVYLRFQLNNLVPNHGQDSTDTLSSEESKHSASSSTTPPVFAPFDSVPTPNTTPDLSISKDKGFALVNVVELEAIISVASDGLVVILRRSRPPIPPLMELDLKPIFAAPWVDNHTPVYNANGVNYPPPPPQQPNELNREDNQAFLQAIRECAVFAWDVVGINRTLDRYALGSPGGEAIPLSVVESIEPND